MGRSFSLRFMTIVLLCSAISGACAVQRDKIRPDLKIRVFNYSSASAVVLEKATAEASAIFARSGIDLGWAYCPPRHSTTSDPECDSQPAPGEIRVRVLGRHLNNSFQDDVFGFAIAPTFATVYYDSAQLMVERTSESDSILPAVLGCLIAHEIGHLLLGENQHTASGIMQASWNIRQIQQLMKGALQFTSKQAMQMRMNGRIRSRQANEPTANAIEMAVR